MARISRKDITKYLYDQLTGNFMGFLAGLSASSLVSNFFEKKSIRNLWGLSSKKTVVDKETFSNLEWVVSLIIGFIVFEIMTRVVKEKIDNWLPIYRRKIYRLIVGRQYHRKARTYVSGLRVKQKEVLTSAGTSIKNYSMRFPLGHTNKDEK